MKRIVALIPVVLAVVGALALAACCQDSTCIKDPPCCPQAAK